MREGGTRKNREYTTVPKRHLLDPKLSLEAKGLLTQMLSRLEDGEFSLSDLERSNRESMDVIEETIRELLSEGYLAQSEEDGETVYTILENPRSAT